MLHFFVSSVLLQLDFLSYAFFFICMDIKLMFLLYIILFNP